MQGWWVTTYWVSQALCLLVYPMIQEYSEAGEFTVLDRCLTAIRRNLIFYAIVIIIGGAMLVLIWYLLRSSENSGSFFDMCVQLSNLWGIFLCVILLGYGLAGVPRYFFRQKSLAFLYTTIHKTHAKRAKVMNDLAQILLAIEELNVSIELQPHVETIKTRMEGYRMQYPDVWKNAYLIRDLEEGVAMAD